MAETNPWARRPGETAKEHFERLCLGPEASLTPEPKPLPPPAEVIPLNPWPVGRKWTAEPSATVNSMPYVPTAIDRLVELQRANAAAARAARLARDPCGVGLYGEETIEDIVRRQNDE
jgi:hypothetical protein